jgi:large subunit ribosomal protein L10
VIPVRSSKKCPGLTGGRTRRGAAQPSLKKIVIADEVRRVFTENNMVVVLQHHGLTVQEWDNARYDLADHNIKIKVFPNRVACKALENTIYKYTQPLFCSTTAVAFSKDPAVTGLFSVLKNHPKLLLIGGKVDNTLMSQDGLRVYSKLPSAQQLQSELTGIVQSPLVNLSCLMQSNQLRLTLLLQQWCNDRTSS